MEGVEEEIMSSNSTRLKGREDDVPSKLDVRVATESQTMNNRYMSDCPGGSLQDAAEIGDVTKSVVSLNGSEPPINSRCSIEEASTRMSVEELTVGNYRNPVLALGSKTSSSKAELFDQHLYRLASGSGFRSADGRSLDSQTQNMDHMLSIIRQQLARAPSEWQNLKPYTSKLSDQSLGAVSGRLRSGTDKNIMKAPAMSNLGPHLKTNMNSSNCSESNLIRALKGKAIADRNQETPSEFVGDQDMEHREERVESKSPDTHDELALKPYTKNKATLCDEDDVQPKSCPRINLREFLRSGGPKRDKVWCLVLFKQLVDLVDLAHSQGSFLHDLKPSSFTVSSSNKLSYMGSFSKKDSNSEVNDISNRKRPSLVQESSAVARGLKQRKLEMRVHSPRSHMQFASSWRQSGTETRPVFDLNKVDTQNSDCYEPPHKNHSSHLVVPTRKQSMPAIRCLEEQWYACPEELNGDESRFRSNIYALGVLLFELLCDCESNEIHYAVMSDLRHRILPPRFLRQNPKEAGFCLWLLHPEPSSRPTPREILRSELLCEEISTVSTAADEEVSELSLHFLTSLQEQKQKHESKLLQDIKTLEDDIKEAERRYSSNTQPTKSQAGNEKRPQACATDKGDISQNGAAFEPNANTEKLMSNIRHLEDAYFFMRTEMSLLDSATKDRERCSDIQDENKDSRTKGKSLDKLDVFFEGLCKFARYSKFEEVGTIRSMDLLSSVNVICSLSFDPDEEHIAAAGISKKIKIFSVDAFTDDSVTVHYPLVEMCSKSKLSSICWNSYIKNYVASTDYDGVVQIWDAGTGQGFSQYTEHQRRAWSVDFSPSDPKKFISGSDDCSVKLWSINEKRSIGTIRSPANVCSVQFSAFSNHMVAFGSANYKVYCYDLRHARSPWCTLAGHEKAVSSVTFMDSDTVVSASTDSSLKLWNLNKTTPSGLSTAACTLTCKGHTNQKNFVGLSVLDDYISCGSETNEVYSYCRSLPTPIASYKFGTADSSSGNEFYDDFGQFVSSVCWRRKSNMLVAANSTGNLKLLKLV